MLKTIMPNLSRKIKKIIARKRLAAVIFFAVIILAGFGFAEKALATYASSGSWTSINLLSGKTVSSINSFVYNLSAKPANTNATIQFSQNNTNWYDAVGTLNASNTLATGVNNTIDLSGLAWSGANFYYKITFTTADGLYTPVLDDIKVNYRDSSDFVIDSTGNVGIGTTGPTSLLHVVGSQPAAVATSGTAATQTLQITGGKGGNTTGTTGQTGGAAAAINLTAGAGGDAPAGSTNAGGGAVTINGGAAGSGLGTAGSYGNVLLATLGGNVGIGTTGPESRVQITGGGLCVGSDVNCNTDNNTEGTVYAATTAMTVYDVAENYPTRDTTLLPGEVVSLDKNFNGPFVKRAEQGEVLLGAISEKPGVLLGGFNGQQFKEEHQVAVTLTGRIDIKVSTENGPIAQGDPITLSSTPGVGMKATGNGNTIGIALESYDGTNPSGKVMVFLDLGYQKLDIDTSILSGGKLQFLDSLGATGFSFALDSLGQVLKLTDALGLSLLEIDSAGTLTAKTLKIDSSALGVGNNNALCHLGAGGAGLPAQAGEILGDCPGTPADIAEYYETDGTVQAGDVVALDTGTRNQVSAGNLVSTPLVSTPELRVKAAVAGDEKLAVGVVSTLPNLAIGELKNALNPKPVALVGRVPVRVSTANGAIQPGDSLALSNIPGVVVKATKAGVVIGRALEAFDGTTKQSPKTQELIQYMEGGKHEERQIEETRQKLQKAIDALNRDFSADQGLILMYVSIGWMGNDLSVQENSSGQLVNLDPEQLRTGLASLGLVVNPNGTLTVDTLRARKVVLEKLEVKDQITGSIYCTWLENGEWRKIQSDCDSFTLDGNGNQVSAGNLVSQPPVVEEVPVVEEPVVVEAVSEPVVEPAPETTVAPEPAPVIEEVAPEGSQTSLEEGSLTSEPQVVEEPAVSEPQVQQEPVVAEPVVIESVPSETP